MNPIYYLVPKGLRAWSKNGAKVSFLKREKFSVPRVVFGDTNKFILIASGLHLEETSGPLFLLRAKGIVSIFSKAIAKNFSLLIYPVVNQVGLAYSPKAERHLFRYDKYNHNYNDGWGKKGSNKAVEVALVEKDILKTLTKHKISLALSLHEDSELQHKGYIYTNTVGPSVTKDICNNIKSRIPKRLLATKKDLLNADEQEFQGGKIENQFCIVESKDKWSLENWLSDDLKIPTVLSESPYGSPLKTRISFQREVILSVLSSFGIG